MTAGIYVVPERIRKMAIPDFPRLRDFLAWIAKQDEPVEAVSIRKVVDVDRAEDLAEAEALAGSAP